MKKLYTLAFLFFLLSVLNVSAQTPYAFYPLNGTALDVAGNHRNGIIVGTPAATIDRFNRVGEATIFNGTTDYIDLPEAFDFPSRTVIVWFTVSQLPGGNGDVIYTSDNANLVNGLSSIHVHDVGGVPTLRIVCDGLLHETPVNLNTWYQAAFVRTPTAVKAYVNGALVSNQAGPTGTHSSNGINHAVVGADRIYGGLTVGKVDDLLIYNTALSDTAINTNYTAWRDSVVQVTGKLYFDANQNQVFDSLEQPVRNQLVNVGSGYVALTNNNGDYIVYPNPGTYTITPNLSGHIAAFTYSPDSIVVQADSLGVTYANNNFGINAPANYCEAGMAIVAIWPGARPGFDNTVNVRYVNALSASAVTQTLTFTYPPQQDYVSATPTPTAVDTLTHTITWNISNLASGSLWQAMVTLHTPVVVALGSILQMNALVTNSTCTMLDSPFQTDEELIVRGSFDPNDKAVSPVGADPGGRIASNSKLSYTIRFQNTGTFMAENVNVIDTISPMLNLSTLHVEAASHNYDVLVNGRVVTFRFNQINLPDSNTNQVMSHGFIKYTIQPAASFVQGSIVQNTANIFFDFNSPVRTNTTLNTADNSLGIPKVQAMGSVFQVYPNPLSSGNWNVITDEEMIGKEIKVFDVAGRLMYSSRIINHQSEIDGANFSQGVYLLRVENAVVRVIKL
jgi:hypothetical protein